jgi:putative toxin-antitoxin system antitoxin component (TIGR02293 family)
MTKLKDKLVKDFDEDLVDMAVEVFGTEKKAEQWFYSPAFGLGNKTPKEFYDATNNRDEVYNLLGRIEHGIIS